MSHRKFEHPRCGSLGFLPRKRCRMMRGRAKAFPVDDPTAKPHLTAFMGYKAGMTHVVRDVKRRTARQTKTEEVTEPVTVIETPPMVVVGVVGYTRTPRGLRCLKTVWAQHLSDDVKRRMYRSWFRSKRKAFSRYSAAWAKDGARKGASVQDSLAKLKKHAVVVRAIVHTQMDLVHIGSRRAHLAEVQVNGGTPAEKVDFTYGLFEKEVPVKSLFSVGECIDTIAVNKGHGFSGVVHRWGVTILPRKSHRGSRKVACIGAWHPARVSFSVARAGQKGSHHRTELHKKIFVVGEAGKLVPLASDMTEKGITPMGGFPHYGVVDQDYLVLKGSVPGPRKRLVTLRKMLGVPRKTWMRDEVELKFVDTSSNLGHGRWQTGDEKRKFLGPMKRDRARAEEAKLATAKAAAAK